MQNLNRIKKKKMEQIKVRPYALYWPQVSVAVMNLEAQ